MVVSLSAQQVWEQTWAVCTYAGQSKHLQNDLTKAQSDMPGQSNAGPEPETLSAPPMSAEQSRWWHIGRNSNSQIREVKRAPALTFPPMATTLFGPSRNQKPFRLSSDPKSSSVPGFLKFLEVISSQEGSHLRPPAPGTLLSPSHNRRARASPSDCRRGQRRWGSKQRFGCRITQNPSEAVSEKDPRRSHMPVAGAATALRQLVRDLSAIWGFSDI